MLFTRLLALFMTPPYGTYGTSLPIFQAREAIPPDPAVITPAARYTERAPSSCTIFTSALTFSGFTSGITPCPRLKMCPGRPPA